MTDDAAAEVVGGLDQPPDLQPEHGSLRLAAPEDDWSRADWEKAAAAALRKSRRLRDDDPDDAVWSALARTTYDGITIPPLGIPDLLDDLATSGRPTRAGGWDVRTRTSGDSAAAVRDLESGATSLWLLADEAGADLAAALDGVRLDLAPVVLESPTLEQAESLVALGPLHPDSNLGATDDAEVPAFARLGIQAGVRAVVADATTVHEDGASDGQELGWLLARGAALLRTLEAAGVPAEQGFGLVELRLAATDEQFATIAKLRAARRLWARMAELCDVPDPRTRIHAVTSRPMTSAFDVHLNLLRGTVAAFGAGVGGADALTVVPFDEPTGEVSDLARRMARNTSALLVAEAHVAAVADPAGGAYAVERLTDDLARVAWTELGAIETEGDDAFA
ncbi:MAG TPA: methylmalonyl-CoA mutase family protein, partial [Nocardioides sp.]|nr:methylmalonyl-CoA mutase family protein [Nocardioides sp.]